MNKKYSYEFDKLDEKNKVLTAQVESGLEGIKNDVLKDVYKEFYYNEKKNLEFSTKDFEIPELKFIEYNINRYLDKYVYYLNSIEKKDIYSNYVSNVMLEIIKIQYNKNLNYYKNIIGNNEKDELLVHETYTNLLCLDIKKMFIFIKENTLNINLDSLKIYIITLIKDIMYYVNKIEPIKKENRKSLDYVNKICNETIKDIENYETMFIIHCPRCHYEGESKFENWCPKCNLTWHE